MAKDLKLKLNSLDDYDRLLEQVVVGAKESDAACLKCTLAYLRTIRFENVPRERALRVWGRPKSELSAKEIKDFEDYVIWRLVELCAKYDFPIQLHTGHARIQGSNPMLLVDMIEANPKTKFILFHGGFPWVSETGLIAMKYNNVWIDSCWLPTLSYTMARRAYQEWLDMVPSNKILWGADGTTVESIYGATVLTRECLSEALAEKVLRGELREEDALRIGRQVMRENALSLFPSLRKRLGKH
jgi:predicted TIM-barrel fold metal-dependent hydrolase